jgi:hypothetical protein
LRFIVVLVVLFAGTLDAAAHRASGPRDISGIPITSVTHGEMAIVARHRADVFALANTVRNTDADFLTLVRYGQLQYADCLWGLVPAAISDETSPFNECSHAYLAATKEVLFRMKKMPQVSRAADDIASQISFEAAREGAVFIGCAYSGETFNTADRVGPQWHDVPFHLPTLAFLGGAFSALPLLVLAATRLSGRREPLPA